MRVFVVLITLLFSSVVLAQTSSPTKSPTPPEALVTTPKIAKDITAKAIYDACEKYFDHTFNTRENIARKSICNGYFFGVGSTLLLLQNGNAKTKFCLPAKLSTADTIHAFLSWGKNNIATKGKEFATKSVIDALQRTYPCK